jgi:uncharacterized membrane protein YfcA
MNSAAGGGTFVAFPALIFLGIPPIQANATATIATWPGTVSTLIAYREELKDQYAKIPKLAILSTIGGTIGSIALLFISNTLFSDLVPYLLLVATLFFTARPTIKRWIQENKTIQANSPVYVRALQILFVIICIYGGFFGAGMGIMLLAIFGLMGMQNMHQMNALRSLIGACANTISVIVFIVAGLVHWPQAIIMSAGAILGGYTSATYFRRLSPEWMRKAVIIIAWTMTIYFFLKSR